MVGWDGAVEGMQMSSLFRPPDLLQMAHLGRMRQLGEAERRVEEGGTEGGVGGRGAGEIVMKGGWEADV